MSIWLKKLLKHNENMYKNPTFRTAREIWKSKHFEENLQRALEQASLTYGDTEKLDVLQGIPMIPWQWPLWNIIKYEALERSHSQNIVKYDTLCRMRPKSQKHRKIRGLGATTFSKHRKIRYLMQNGHEIEHLRGSFGNIKLATYEHLAQKVAETWWKHVQKLHFSNGSRNSEIRAFRREPPKMPGTG